MFLFTIAVAIRFVLGYTGGFFKETITGEAINVARHLLHDHAFIDPFDIPTGPTAHVAPVYPMLLALVLKFVPYGPRFTLCTAFLGVIPSAFVWASLPYAAPRLGLDWRAGFSAALIGVFIPLRRRIELWGNWETSLAALVLLGLVILTFERRKSFSHPRWAVTVGCAWGLALLLQPEFLVIFAAILMVLVATSEAPRLPALRAAVLALASMSLMITPWLIRNYVELGGFTYVRSNFGLELDVSNHDGAVAPIERNLVASSDHPDVDQASALMMARLGERKYYHFRLTRALNWIEAHPAAFLALTGQRFFDFWVPERRSLPLRAIELLLTLTAIAGLAMLLRASHPLAPFIAAIWISQPLVHYLIQADERYRYPIEWTIVLCAGYFAWRMVLASFIFRRPD